MDKKELPAAQVTIDQIVAGNIRHWRRTAGMTQEDLGHFTGLSAANISAIERSADDGRERRRFDAHALITFAEALGVPLIALFLPPLDDGGQKRYVFAALDGECGEEQDMQDLMRVIMHDSDDHGPVMEKYRTRLTFSAEHYLGADWAKDVGRWFARSTPAEILAARAEALRSRQQALQDLAEEIGGMAAGIEDELAGEDQP